MKTLTINGGKELSGVVEAPPSEDYTHKFVVAATLSSGITRIHRALLSRATLLTRGACEAFDARVSDEEQSWAVQGPGELVAPDEPINCGESEDAAGLVMSLSLAAEGRSVFAGEERILRTSAAQLRRILRSKAIESRRNRPPSVRGPALPEGVIKLRRTHPSLISGIMLVSPKSEGDVEIHFTGDLKPTHSEIAVTLDVMSKMGVTAEVDAKKKRVLVPSHQNYRPSVVAVEGSFLMASLVLVASVGSGSLVRVTKLNPRSLQPERKFLDALRQFGVDMHVEEDFVEIDARGAKRNPISIDATEERLLFPATVLACFSDKWSTFTGFKYKEDEAPHSIRMLLIELTRAGAETIQDGRNLYVRGGNLQPATMSSHGSDVIAAACTALALGVPKPSKIHGIEYTSEYFLSVLESLASVGADVKVSEHAPGEEP